jgi:hypothetical protein
MTVKEFFEKVGAFFKKVGEFVGKYWKLLLGALGTVAATIAGIKIYRRLKVVFDTLLPKPVKKLDWLVTDANKIKVVVPGTDNVQTIKMPKGIDAIDVTAVGYDKDKQIICVEVKHEVVDRKHSPAPTPGIASDGTGGDPASE